MWRRAQDPVQKKAILDQFLPLTRDDYVSAVIAFADDENDEVRSLAFEKLKALDHAVLIKRVRPDMSRATVRTLARLCVADPNPQLIAALVNSKRLTWPVIKERWLSPNEELWRALIVNRSFILLSHPDREAVLAFLKTFSASLTAAYREQLGWVTPKELKEFVVPSDEEPRPPEPPAPVKAPADKSAPVTPAGPVPPVTPIDAPEGDRLLIKGLDSFEEVAEPSREDAVAALDEGQEINISGALFDTGQGVVTEDDEVVDLDSIDLEVPDFLLVEDPFAGMSKEEIAEHRKNIADIIDKLTMPQRMKLATVGNMEARKLLIKDPRRMVAMAVLSNGGITPGEIAALAGNPATMQDVVEYIASSRNLCKNYMVKVALVTNPKTPIKTGMLFLDVIRRADLKKIAESKNISPIIRNMAKKRIH
ncbi:MAG TPA: hypothetical protein PKH10_02860 [bacterium]|nr:hypothetical protein [bacterium]